MTDSLYLEKLCNDYDAATLKLLQAIRSKLNDAEVSSMSFTVYASGRVASGDLNLKYIMDDGEYDGAKAKGGTLYPVLVELLRRRGFDLRHKPLAIGYDGTVSKED